MAWAPRVHVPLPLISIDLSFLKDDIGADVVDRIAEMDQSWQKCRAARLFATETRITLEGLDELIAHLGQEVIDNCHS